MTSKYYLRLKLEVYIFWEIINRKNPLNKFIFYLKKIFTRTGLIKNTYLITIFLKIIQNFVNLILVQGKIRKYTYFYRFQKFISNLIK